MSKLVLLAIGFLLPPLAVLLTDGLGAQFLLNLVLTLFGWIPGMLHSWYLTMRS